MNMTQLFRYLRERRHDTVNALQNVKSVERYQKFELQFVTICLSRFAAWIYNIFGLKFIASRCQANSS